jgi:hypothetical protein
VLGALVQGAVIAVVVFIMQSLRQGMRSTAVDAGRGLRARRGRADSAD